MSTRRFAPAASHAAGLSPRTPVRYDLPMPTASPSTVMIPPASPAGFARDLLAGAQAAMFTLPGAVAFGGIAFAALGPDYAATAAAAGLIGGVVGGLVAAPLAGRAGGIAAPSGQLAVLLAAVVALGVRHGLGAGACAALAAGAVVVAGLLQLLLAGLRLGRLIAYVPYPVIAGCGIGAVVVICVAQVPALLGGGGLRPIALGAGLAAIAGLVFARRFLPRMPDVLVGLGLGCAVHYGALAATGATAQAGPVLGALPALAGGIGGGWHVEDAAFAAAAWAALPLALGIGVLGAITSLVAAVVVDGSLRGRHDPDRELRAQGFANLFGGACGGLPVALSDSRTLIAWRAGARGRGAAVGHALCLLAAGTLLAPLIAGLPLAVLAGLLMASMLRSVDPWAVDLAWLACSRGGRPGRDLLANVAVVVAVAGLTVFAGLFPALLVGLAVGVVQFIASLSASVVRRSYRAAAVRSKRVRADAAMEVLGRLGERVAVFELQGSVFFGTADRLAQAVEAVAPEIEWAVLDLRRVASVDSSGARIIQRLHEDLVSRGKTLVLAHLAPGRPLWPVFAGLGVIERIGSNRCFAELDSALEHVEDGLLARHAAPGSGGHASGLAGLDIAAGLDPAQIATLATHLVEKRYTHDEVIFGEGDRGDALFVLIEGEVSVRTRLDHEAGSLRLSSFSPGVVFGEMALLEGAPRSATVVADRDAICLALSVEAYERLGREHPALALRLALNLGRQLAQRLRRANGQLRALEH